MNRAGSIMEVIWFVFGGLLLFIGIDETIENGINIGAKFLALALLAFFMYFRRRRMRIQNK